MRLVLLSLIFLSSLVGYSFDWQDRVPIAIDEVFDMDKASPPIPVPFGPDCTIASRLQEVAGRSRAFPFDWLKIDIDTIYKLLENDFYNYLNPEICV